MNSLIYYTPGRFKTLSHLPDVQVWLAMFSIFTDNISFVDRTNKITSPIRTSTALHNVMPEYQSSFNMSFSECAIDRANQIYLRHVTTGVPIRLAWSGGTDSTAALMAFIELLGIEKTKNAIEIVMTSNTITENPYIWDKIVRKENFKLIHAMNFTESWLGNEIIVNGEAGDQIHGVDIYRALRQWYGKDSMNISWTRTIIEQHVTIKAPTLTTDQIEFLADILIQHVQHAPMSIVTLGDFWWWINFSCKWSSVFYRSALTATIPINANYIENYYFPFYASNNFQHWSMNKFDEKHQGNWETYKWKAKEFICKTSGCDELYFKHRQGSLYTVLSHIEKSEAIDNDFKFYKNTNPEEWYNPSNSFV